MRSSVGGHPRPHPQASQREGEGDRCPYCNGSLLIHRLGKDWPPFYDSLYRVLGYEQLKSCDNCRFWL